MVASNQQPKLKRTLREQMLARRRALSDEDTRRAGIAAAAHLAELEICQAGAVRSPEPTAASGERSVAVSANRSALLFSSLTGEIDTLPIDARLRSLGFQVAYPKVVAGRQLSLHLARPSELVVAPGRFGIAEPPPAATRIDPAELDLVIAPGLAFDRAGRRLGFGGGYYDRLLAGIRAVLVGVCLPFQIVDEVPVEAHDVRLHFLLCGDPNGQGALLTTARRPC